MSIPSGEQSATVTLVINPAASRARLLVRQLPAISALLSARGFTVRTIETSADPDSARGRIAPACASSALLLACGGDGTIHAVVQAMLATKSEAALGVVPLGAANALARNLQLPLDPLAAITRLLAYEARVVPVGEVRSATSERKFVTMAGCGPDGALAHLLAGRSRGKKHLGRSAYALHAARLFFTRRWPAFQVEYRLTEDSQWRSTDAVALLASRVANLGGLFSRLTPLAALTDPFLHVQLLRPPAQLSLPAWFAGAHVGVPNPWLQTFNVAELRCTPGPGAPVFAQADAEPIGGLPLTMRIVPDALRLLMPVP